MPTSKVTAGGLAGLLSTVLIGMLQNRLHIQLTGDEAALVTAVIMTIAAYVTPHIPPPPQQA
jgi:hypothetical protein